MYKVAKPRRVVSSRLINAKRFENTEGSSAFLICSAGFVSADCELFGDPSDGDIIHLPEVQ
jgi:hypothetical protein